MEINKCINGNSLEWMKTIDKPFADLIIADPPFNIDFKYDSYNDNRPDDDFLAWSEEWIYEAFRLLKSGGNMLIFMGDEYISDIDTICRKKLEMKRLEWLIWHYKFGQSGKLDNRKKFTRSKTHGLRFGKDKKCYFDPISVATPSDRQLLYNDKRADPRGKCPDDVFSFKRIAGTHKERVKGVPTQMPVKLVRIWVKAMCKPGGLVFDPFAGSGSSLMAAKLESRNFLGVELSEECTKIINDRLSK